MTSEPVEREILEQLEQLTNERLEEEIEALPEEWGDEIELAEGERFFGRFLDQEVDGRFDAPRPVYLLRDTTGTPCYIRGRKMLDSEIQRVRPARGDFILIARGDDREGKHRSYHAYAVAVAPCSEPLPEPGDGIPF